MKKTNSKIKKNLSLTLGTLLVIALLFTGLLEKTGVIHLFSQKKQPSTAQIQEAKTNAQKKQQITTQTSPKTSTPDSNVNSTQAATANPDNITLTAEKSDSSNVTVFTKLIGYSDGSCTLTVSNGGKLVTENAIVIYQPEFSTCAGFSVPISQLGAGNWTIILTVSSKGNTQTKTISLGVS